MDEEIPTTSVCAVSIVGTIVSIKDAVNSMTDDDILMGMVVGRNNACTRFVVEFFNDSLPYHVKTREYSSSDINTMAALTLSSVPPCQRPSMYRQINTQPIPRIVSRGTQYLSDQLVTTSNASPATMIQFLVQVNFGSLGLTVNQNTYGGGAIVLGKNFDKGNDVVFQKSPNLNLVQIGDSIVSFNGQLVKNYPDIVAFMQREPAPFVLGLERPVNKRTHSSRILQEYKATDSLGLSATPHPLIPGSVYVSTIMVPENNPDVEIGDTIVMLRVKGEPAINLSLPTPFSSKVRALKNQAQDTNRTIEVLFERFHSYHALIFEHELPSNTDFLTLCRVCQSTRLMDNDIFILVDQAARTSFGNYPHIISGDILLKIGDLTVSSDLELADTIIRQHIDNHDEETTKTLRLTLKRYHKSVFNQAEASSIIDEEIAYTLVVNDALQEASPPPSPAASNHNSTTSTAARVPTCARVVTNSSEQLSRPIARPGGATKKVSSAVVNSTLKPGPHVRLLSSTPDEDETPKDRDNRLNRYRKSEAKKKPRKRLSSAVVNSNLQPGFPLLSSTPDNESPTSRNKRLSRHRYRTTRVNKLQDDNDQRKNRFIQIMKSQQTKHKSTSELSDNKNSKKSRRKRRNKSKKKIRNTMTCDMHPRLADKINELNASVPGAVAAGAGGDGDDSDDSSSRSSDKSRSHGNYSDSDTSMNDDDNSSDIEYFVPTISGRFDAKDCSDYRPPNLSTINPTIDTMLTQRGTDPGYNVHDNNESIHAHPEMELSHEAFLHWIKVTHDISLYHCPCCKERRFDTHLCTKKDAKDEECTRCYQHRKQYDGRRKFTVTFDMDPFPNGYDWAIHWLHATMIEEMLVAPILTIFRVYILPSGAVKYQGNVINYEQNLTELAKALPRFVKDIPATIVVRKSNPTFPEGYKDFDCRRRVVEMLLEYVFDNFTQYQALEHTNQ